MSSPVEATKSLLRTAVRTFHPNPKQVFLYDALLTYVVLHVEEMVPLFPANTFQAKEIRSLLNPLRAARLVSVGGRTEVREGHTRSATREYYYVNYHEAVDAIKYRLVKLQEKVQDLYKQAEGQKKDWSCPRCKAEYDALSILDNVDPERGFYCERCGQTLVENEEAVRERGDHAKIRNLNDQMRPFNALLAVIDSGEVPENDFETAFAHKRPIPERKELTGSGTKARWMDVSQQKNQDVRKVQSTVDEKAINIQLVNAQDQEAREAAEKLQRRAQMAKQNQMPDWMTGSVAPVADGSAVKKEEGGASPLVLPGVKKEEDEKKGVLGELTQDSKMNDEMEEYVREMEREQREQERREAEAAQEEDDEDDDDEDDFEDARPSGVGTPMSSHMHSMKQEITPTKLNGSLKRELDDGDSISGTDTGANTPADSAMTPLRDAKRVKLENGSFTSDPTGTQAATALATTNGVAAADSDEDEEDFEDV